MTLPEREVCPCGEIRDDFGECWRCDAAIDPEGLVRGGEGPDPDEVKASGNAFAYCVAAALVFLVALGIVKFVVWVSAAAVPTVPK